VSTALTGTPAEHVFNVDTGLEIVQHAAINRRTPWKLLNSNIIFIRYYIISDTERWKSETYSHIELEGKKCMCLIDTGCDRSCLPLSNSVEIA
jgi:hypothetical protein